MKNILKTSALAFLFLASLSCENDDQTIVTAKGGPELLTPLDGSSYILTPDNAQNEATTLVWNHADYDVQTEVNYEVQTALSGTDFATIVSAGTTTSRFMVLTVEQLNTVALNLGINPFQASDVDVRIKSSLGSNTSLEAYSNTIKITLTPYTTDLPKLAVPGNHQGWDPPTAPLLASSGFGETDFEGYIWLDGEFKFVERNAAGAFEWGNTDYGDDGSFSGVLAEQNESNAIATAGYYHVKANTSALTYSTTLTNWAVTGSGTPNGWPDNGVVDHNMIYNQATKKWEIILALSGGNEIKFRANDDWALNYGDNGADGLLNEGGDNIAVPASGNYLIELDLSNPRAYTYTLTPQ
ncbi:SusE domain-containing protein [uncultured Flavobacterium sp.]|uniref:SusE domain-containing protein n=1 Tax=uncultured Flavobacterium sp. TaxID=165435 RepID=UPI0030C7A5CA